MHAPAYAKLAEGIWTEKKIEERFRSGSSEYSRYKRADSYMVIKSGKITRHELNDETNKHGETEGSDYEASGKTITCTEEFEDEALGEVKIIFKYEISGSEITLEGDVSVYINGNLDKEGSNKTEELKRTALVKTGKTHRAGQTLDSPEGFRPPGFFSIMVLP